MGGNHKWNNGVLPYNFGRPDDDSLEKNDGEDRTVEESKSVIDIYTFVEF